MNIRHKLNSIMENDIVKQGKLSTDRVETPNTSELGFDETHDLSLKEAKVMLDNGPDGVINHECMEKSAFVFITQHGEYGFFYGEHDSRIESWDWVKDIEELDSWDDGYDINNDWSYIPGSHVRETHDGQELWNIIKSAVFGKMIK